MVRLLQTHRARTKSAGVCSSGLNGPPRYLAVLHAAAIFSLSGGRGCSLVNCGGRRDASRLYYWSAFSSDSWSRLAKEKCYRFCRFPFFSPSIISSHWDLQTLNNWLKVRRTQNRTFSIKSVVHLLSRRLESRGVLLCAWILVQPSVCPWRGIRESAGKTNPFPAIRESHGFVVSFRRCSRNPTLPGSQVRSHPLLLPPSAC